MLKDDCWSCHRYQQGTYTLSFVAYVLFTFVLSSFFTCSLFIRDALEDQRLAIERHYEEKLESMRREMESRNEREKENLKQELEKLRVNMPMDIPIVSIDDSPGAEDDPYQVMKSIAFEPLNVTKRRTKSFNIRDITGDRTGVPAANESDSTSESVRASWFSPSPSPGLDHELPLLSPATGQHNAVSPPISDSPIDSVMKNLLDTYDVVGNNSETLPVQQTSPVDMSNPNFNTSSRATVDIGYVTRNMSLFQVDNGLSMSCPQHAMHSSDKTDGPQ